MVGGDDAGVIILRDCMQNDGPIRAYLARQG